MLSNYMGGSRVSAALVWHDSFQTLFLRLLLHDIKRNKFSEAQRNKLLEIFTKSLWILPQEACSESDIYWIAVVLWKLSASNAIESITKFLERCYTDENFCSQLGPVERKKMLVILKDIIDQAQKELMMHR